MSGYFHFYFHCDPSLKEIAMAFLQELPFPGFEETPKGFMGDMPANICTPTIEGQIKAIAAQFQISVEKEFLPERNWNQVWEDQFQPVLIDGKVAIRADFHPHFPDRQYEIQIHPKMAFGTGHHETTSMMISTMLSIPFSNKKVLDYGCGTGILGILACQLGASSVIGVDNEWPAYESAIENAAINGTTCMEVRYGTLDMVAETAIDVVLANINRNIILASLDALMRKTASGATLLFSGVLDSDLTIMESAFSTTGLQVEECRTMGKWLCFHCKKLI